MDSKCMGFNRPIFYLNQGWRTHPASRLRANTGCLANFAGQSVADPFPPQRATDVTGDHSFMAQGCSRCVEFSFAARAEKFSLAAKLRGKLGSPRVGVGEFWSSGET
jgi:hypothetical protein